MTPPDGWTVYAIKTVHGVPHAYIRKDRNAAVSCKDGLWRVRYRVRQTKHSSEVVTLGDYPTLIAAFAAIRILIKD